MNINQKLIYVIIEIKLSNSYPRNQKIPIQNPNFIFPQIRTIEEEKLKIEITFSVAVSLSFFSGELFSAGVLEDARRLFSSAERARV